LSLRLEKSKETDYRSSKETLRPQKERFCCPGVASSHKGKIRAMPIHEHGMDYEEAPALTWPIRRLRRDGGESAKDWVVLEEPLEIVLNGKPVAVLMRMPGWEKELAAGFCISEGYVQNAKDILLIHHCGLGLPAPGEEDGEESGPSRNRIEITAATETSLPGGAGDVVRLIRSGCGAADVSGIAESLPRLSPGFSVESALLFRLRKEMHTLQSVYRKVGGIHGAALFDASGLAVHLAEDIGRHNAVDKALGYCMLRKIPLHDKILVTSGRASYEMAVKAIQAEIPVVATFSAPTSLAVRIAQDRGLTLIGYLRGSRMNVYTHPQRLM
jgi:FdhD protein